MQNKKMVRELDKDASLAALHPDTMLLIRMILKIVQVVNSNAYSLTFRIGTRYLIAAL